MNPTISNHNKSMLSKQDLYYVYTSSIEPSDEDDYICRSMKHSYSITPSTEEDIEHPSKTKLIKVSKSTPDYESLRPFFSWMPTDIIKIIFQDTT